MARKKEMTICIEHTDCFANRKGRCSCLSNTIFKDRYGNILPCPFYKHETEVDWKKIRQECEAYAAMHSGKGAS